MKSFYKPAKSALVFVVALFLQACNEAWLEERPLDFLSTSNAFQTPSDIELGITALHADVREWFARNSANTYVITAFGTDLAFYGEDPGGNELLNNYPTVLTPSNEIVDFYWKQGYTLIQKTNVLAGAIDKIDNSDWTTDSKNVALAEILFFRAFAYRTLVVLFGDIPLLTESIDYAKTDFVRNTKAEIYAQLEKDLFFAAEHLPARGTERQPGRITRGAALHLLSEVSLAQSKYQQAIEAASKVINGEGYALMNQRFGSKSGKDVFGTGDVYFDLFTLGNHSLSTNTEGIWVIQIEPNIVGGGSWPGERVYGPAYFRIGNTPDGYKAIRGELYNGSYTGYSDTLGRGVGWARCTRYVAYDIWKDDWHDDIRNAEHNIKRNFYFDNPASAYHKKKISWDLYPSGTRNALKDTCQYIFPYFMKVASPLEHYTNPSTSGNGLSHKDVYAFRLAETLLLRAEAYLGAGNKQLAAADVNVVRNRAHTKPVSAEQISIDYILDERARELYTEEWRMITLMRLGKLVERVRKYNDNPIYPGLNIQNHNGVWPIPQSQIDLNVSRKMEQNPGY